MFYLNVARSVATLSHHFGGGLMLSPKLEPTPSPLLNSRSHQVFISTYVVVLYNTYVVIISSDRTTLLHLSYMTKPKASLGGKAPRTSTYSLILIGYSGLCLQHYNIMDSNVCPVHQTHSASRVINLSSTSG